MTSLRYYRDGAVDAWFARAMVTLAESLGVKLSEERIRVYAQLLSDVAQPDMAEAFRRAATERTSTFFPSVGELTRFVRPGEDDRALLAWARLGQATMTVGAYVDLICVDGAAAEALLTVFGSWPAFVAVDEGPALGARRQEFLAAYRQAARHAVPARRLPGICATTSEGVLAEPSRALVGILPSAGAARVVRDSRELGVGDGHARPALAEGRDAEDAEGPAGP